MIFILKIFRCGQYTRENDNCSKMVIINIKEFGYETYNFS